MRVKTANEVSGTPENGISSDEAFSRSFMVAPEPLGPRWKYFRATTRKIDSAASKQPLSPPPNSVSKPFFRDRSTSGHGHVKKVDSLVCSHSPKLLRGLRIHGAHIDDEGIALRICKYPLWPLINLEDNLIARQARQHNVATRGKFRNAMRDRSAISN